MPTQNIDVTLKQHNKLDICTKKSFHMKRKIILIIFHISKNSAVGGRLSRVKAISWKIGTCSTNSTRELNRHPDAENTRNFFTIFGTLRAWIKWPPGRSLVCCQNPLKGKSRRLSCLCMPVKSLSIPEWVTHSWLSTWPTNGDREVIWV